MRFFLRLLKCGDHVNFFTGENVQKTGGKDRKIWKGQESLTVLFEDDGHEVLPLAPESPGEFIRNESVFCDDLFDLLPRLVRKLFRMIEIP